LSNSLRKISPIWLKLENANTDCDDDARVGKHIRQALLAEGYAVDFAQDGDEALWLAENNTYDAIVLDVMMPLRDGFTIARSLRRKNDQTPVLFLTAKGEVEDKVRGLDVGGDDYMVKPFSVVELLARVRALLRRQRRLVPIVQTVRGVGFALRKADP
jgi:DNA-binding response OmpR family regulator